MIQGSDEWFSARLGKVTASRIIDIIPGKSGYKASRKNYMAEKVCEILTGQRAEGYTSKEMEWGTEHEPEARLAYEAKTGAWVDEVGFIIHHTIGGFGASPDGIVSGGGAIEIKCPNTATHLDTLLNETVKPGYIYQMHGVMMCNDEPWCDFVSFDPRLPEEHQIFIKRFERDEDMVKQIEKEVKLFNAELHKLLEKLEMLK